METPQEHNCLDKQKTISDINEYGLSVILIDATMYLPAFAYSIGLWRKFKHPDIICFGLSINTLHHLVNDVAEIVKKGQVILSNNINNDIFENGKAQFLVVDKKNLVDYFGVAIDYYSSEDFPALQLVWTDRYDKFPWEVDFEEEFIFRQPLLDRNAEFKFRERDVLGVFTTRQWLELSQPILQVIHEHDGDWQFLTGDQMPEDAKIVALKEMVLKDVTLTEVFNLEYGESAQREFIGGEWTRVILSS